MRWWWIPLLLFALFLGVAAYQLNQPKDDFVPSAMIGEPLPAFDLPPALAGVPGVSSADFRDGKPRLLMLDQLLLPSGAPPADREPRLDQSRQVPA